MDIEINQFIKRECLPAGPLLPGTFPELNLELKRGCRYYYQELMKGKQKGNCPNLSAMVAANAIGQLVVQVLMGGNMESIMIPNHGSYDDFHGVDEATAKLIKTQTEHILREVAESVVKSCGSIPGEFSEILKKINTADPPKFNWRRYLRMFIGGSEEVDLELSRRKLNLRFIDLPGTKYEPRLHVLVALDTSGSVSSVELQEFMHEIYHMHKTGTEVTVIQCDTAISSIEKFNPKSEYKIQGRGGTSFEPVTEYYSKHTHKYSCLIYFTDGEASAPPHPRGKMLWVLSSKSKRNESLKGPQIILN
jgi:predicted metal-dependent peptidase